jgi:cardiolipin synthase (CMP-forming)
MLNLPNFLTLLRLIAIPGFLILLVNGRAGLALGVFVGAGVTDALDGAIARLTDSKTKLGAFLDPAADKLLLLSAFIALTFMNRVPSWLTVVVLSRDVIIVLGYFLLFTMTHRAIDIRPTVTGKFGTFLQLLAVTLVLVGLVRPRLVPLVVLQPVFYASAVVTAVAGLQYLVRGLVWLQREGAEGEPPR